MAHYDGNKQNNRADNLRWADWADNRADGKRLGEILREERHPRAILNADDVREIRRQHEGGASMRQIARSYGTCHQHIGDIIRRRIWKNV